MKRIALYTTGLMMWAATASAQTEVTIETAPVNRATFPSVFVGPVIGAGNSWVGNLPGDVQFKSTGYVGVSLIELPSHHWGWGGQVTLSSEGYAVNDLGGLQTIKPLYLRVPVRAYYFFGNRHDWLRPNLYLGPSFGLKLAEYATVSNAYYDNYMAHTSSNFRTFDLGINGGGGLDFRVARHAWLNLDLGFYAGLSDAVKDADNTYNPNHNMTGSIGLLFDIR